MTFSLRFASIFAINLFILAAAGCYPVMAQENPSTTERCPANLTESLEELKATLPGTTIDKLDERSIVRI
jgi:hypothetical protein